MSESDELFAAALARSKIQVYFRGLTPPQKAFILDRSTRKAALCSRRAGKTHALLANIIRVCLNFPESECLYIALTRGSARGIVWDELKRINRNVDLGLQFNEVELSARFPNGSTLHLNGAETEADIEKFNGRKLRFIGIDECGSFPEHFRKMVREVLTPCLMDLRGTLVLLGTPKAHCRGLFYEVTSGKLPGWSVHRWTWKDNPHVPQDWVENERRDMGVSEDDPAFQREYCGKWVRSDSSLMYPYDEERNGYTALPIFPAEWHYVFGVDLGWHDKTAFSVFSWCDASPILWGRYFSAKSEMRYETIGEDLEAAIATFGQKAIVDVCMDTGGLGKTIAESLEKRLKRRIQTAQKTEKLANAAMMRIDMRKGLIKVPRAAAIIEEWDTLLLTEDGKEDPTAANHLSDAALYAYRQARHYWGKTREPPKPKNPGRWFPQDPTISDLKSNAGLTDEEILEQQEIADFGLDADAF